MVFCQDEMGFFFFFKKQKNKITQKTKTQYCALLPLSTSPHAVLYSYSCTCIFNEQTGYANKQRAQLNQAGHWNMKTISTSASCRIKHC